MTSLQQNYVASYMLHNFKLISVTGHLFFQGRGVGGGGETNCYILALLPGNTITQLIWNSWLSLLKSVRVHLDPAEIAITYEFLSQYL